MRRCWSWLLVAVVGLASGARLDPAALVDNYTGHLVEAGVELNAADFQAELTRMAATHNGTSPTATPDPLAELIYNNWYLFEKVYRNALNRGGLPDNLVDFAVTEARLYSLIASGQAGDDKLRAKQKDLAIKYKILTEAEKNKLERAMPNASHAVTGLDFWRA